MKCLVKHSKSIFLVAHYTLLVALVSMAIVILIMQSRNHQAQLEAIHLSTETILQEITDMTAEITQSIEDGTTETGIRITGTNSRIQRIETVYSELLTAQLRRTLDSLYTEEGLREREEEAARLFREGRFAQAWAYYQIIAQALPENADAQFYHLYSLFLSNRLDRGNYRLIREGMETLERKGYRRAEIREVLAFIAMEENAWTEADQ
jgi:hypothetical protein